MSRETSRERMRSSTGDFASRGKLNRTVSIRIFENERVTSEEQEEAFVAAAEAVMNKTWFSATRARMYVGM